MGTAKDQAKAGGVVGGTIYREGGGSAPRTPYLVQIMDRDPCGDQELNTVLSLKNGNFLAFYRRDAFRRAGVEPGRRPDIYVIVREIQPDTPVNEMKILGQSKVRTDASSNLNLPVNIRI